MKKPSYIPKSLMEALGNLRAGLRDWFEFVSLLLKVAGWFFGVAVPTVAFYLELLFG